MASATRMPSTAALMMPPAYSAPVPQSGALQGPGMDFTCRAE